MVGVTECFLALLIVAVTVFFLRSKSSSSTNPNSSSSSPSSSSSNSLKTNQKHSDSDAKSDASKLPMDIFFGSQSGTAETFAAEMAAEAKLHGFKATVHDLEHYEREALGEVKFAVFLMATFGEGEPTDNAAEFYKWLMSDERTADLHTVQYAVFALGNRQYEHYCKVGRDVDSRLHELGAARLLEHGEGDDDGSLEDDYTAWKKTFWNVAKTHFGLDAATSGEPTAATSKFVPACTLNWLPDDSSYEGGLNTAQADPKHRAEIAKVIENRELRKWTEDGGSTRHIEIDISGLQLNYITADNLGVCPRNDFKLASKMCQRLGLKPNQIFQLSNDGKKKLPLPSVCSVYDALLYYLDFQSLPRANLLATMKQYVHSEEDQLKLNYYTSTGKDEFTNDQKSIQELFDELPSLQVPFVDFLEWCPKLLPRFYTISSSSLVHPRQIAITVSLTTHAKPRGRVYAGICSSYLCNLRAGRDEICVFVRPSAFRLPKQITTTPIVMVGPGTGIAPFRAFVQEATHLINTGTQPHSLTLYFGCRDRTRDFLYEEELKQAEQQKVLSELHVAFSRETEQKHYVQHRLESNGPAVWQAIQHQKAHFYVCGSTSMGRSVREVITKVAEQYGKMNETEAAEWMKQLQASGRYIQELWS